MIEREGERRWLAAAIGRLHFEWVAQIPTAFEIDVGVSLQSARLLPRRPARWCRWLDECASVRSRTAFARATRLLHAELPEQ